MSTPRKPAAEKSNQPIHKRPNAHGDARKTLESALADAEAAGLIVPCRGVEAGAWTAEDAETLVAAALYCEDCPALDQCRGYAVAAGEDGGAWGGLLPAAITRERRRTEQTRQTERRRAARAA